jgi:hypothetical protein
MLYELDKFHSVIAMEYIDGEKAAGCDSVLTKSAICTCNNFPCEGIEWETVSRLWGITDLNSDNVLTLIDGTNIVVDVTR